MNIEAVDAKPRPLQ